MDRIVLVLKSTDEQQKALEELLAAQHDPASPDFHRWLTPEDFEARFGVSKDDVRRVTDWLESHGFAIEEVPAGARSIVFSGTAAQVEAAFETPIHSYHVNGRIHHANAREPRIPASLADVVAGPLTLHDFPREHMHASLETAPDFTSGSSHYVSPADFATIYDVNALYTSGIDGSGQAIAIVGRSNILLSDVQTFRSTFGLPVNNPVIMLNGRDPGIVNGGEVDEACLDVEWSGAVAPKATVRFVVSASTSSTDGVDLSAQYIVSRNVAPVMSASFGQCEINMGASERAFYNNLWQQAAAQGITVLVSSGDSGAAGCDGGSSTRATHGLGVNGLCSTPYSVCVGGTQFAEAGSNVYWSATNGSKLSSALSYIPEVAWNESALMMGGSGLWGTGGGASAYYSKPSWQTGAGVPADGKRDVPDVSLSAAGHDGYLVEIQGGLYSIGGTSASSPAFAGLMALVNQKTQTRQGNANTSLYALAAAAPSAFHGTTHGNNSVPGLVGFTAGPQYNQATGLGSVDAFLFVNHWADVAVPVPALTMTQSASTVTMIAGGSATVNLSTYVNGGFSSSVALSTSTLTGITTGFSVSSFAAPGSGSSTLTISAANNATLGAFTLTVTASGGGQTKNVTITVNVVAPFTIQSTIASATIVQTRAVPFLIYTSGGPGYNSATSISSNPPGGLSVIFNPTTVPAPGSGGVFVSISAGTNVTPGNYTVRITGSDGTFSTFVDIAVTVVPVPAYNLTAPASFSIAPGGSATVPIGVTGSNPGGITLSASGQPAGVTVRFSGMNMVVTSTASAPLGSYTINVVPTAAGIQGSPISLTLNVGKFSLVLQPASANVSRGRQSTVTVRASVTNGFNAPLTLSASNLPSMMSADFVPPAIANPLSGSSTMTINVAPASLTGTKSFNVIATSGGVSVSIPISVTVQ